MSAAKYHCHPTQSVVLRPPVTSASDEVGSQEKAPTGPLYASCSLELASTGGIPCAQSLPGPPECPPTPSTLRASPMIWGNRKRSHEAHKPLMVGLTDSHEPQGVPNCLPVLGRESYDQVSTRHQRGTSSSAWEVRVDRPLLIASACCTRPLEKQKTNKIPFRRYLLCHQRHHGRRLQRP